MLETLVLSILNHDCAIASAAARMVAAAGGRPIIEMGSRRTHEQAAVAVGARGLPGRLRVDVQPRGGAALRRARRPGTAAHAFTLLHDDERAAFARPGRRRWAPARRCSSTPTTSPAASSSRSRWPGPALGAVRIDSGDLGVLARHAREQLDGLGATGTRIVVSGDLDEFAIAALAAAPVDVYGAGHGGGHRLRRADRGHGLQARRGRRPAGRQALRAQGRASGGRKTALRAHKPTGTALEEIVVAGAAPTPGEGERLLQRPLMRGGEPVADLPTLAESREHLRAATVTLPWDGLKLSRGEPAIPTRLG